MFYSVKVSWIDGTGNATCDGMDEEFILESDRDLATVKEEVITDSVHSAMESGYSEEWLSENIPSCEIHIAVCSDCGEELDKNCMGIIRCPSCYPCLCCSDS